MDRRAQERHKRNNALQSVLLFVGMLGLLALLGFLLLGPEGVAWAFAVGLVALLLSPRITPRAVLRLYGARPLSRGEAPSVIAAVEELSRRAGLEQPPRLYYIPSSMLNAFSVGSRDQSAIAITDGLARALDFREIVAVLAHEISHVRNNDMRVMGLADLISRLTSTLSLLGQILLLLNLPLLLLGGGAAPWPPILALILAPSLSALMQLGLSRSREFDADLDAAGLSGDPRGLAQALDKMERRQSGLFERLFLPGRNEPHPSLLRTHPETEERIRRLLELEDRPQRHPRYAPEEARYSPRHPPATRPPRWRPLGFWR